MTTEQFQQLTDYVNKNYPELYNQYAPYNFNLSDTGLSIIQPAMVSNETHEKLIDIINKWKEENYV